MAVSKKLLFKSISYILVVCLSIGCSQKPDNVTKYSITNQPKLSSSNLLRIDINTEPPSLDPQIMQDAVSARVVYDLFAGLIDFDQSSTPIPGMAKSWDISPDGKIYTFYLRDDLKFSDGSPITAKDFVYSWQRGANPKTGATYGYQFAYLVNGADVISGKMSPDKLGVKAIGNKTLQVSLVAPNSAFLQILTLPIFYVISEPNINKYGNNWLKPDNMVTSGAYVLKEHVIKGHILTEKNSNYYDATNVKIQQVKYLPIEDTNMAASMFKSGDLDITWTTPIDQVRTFKKEYPKQFKIVGQEGAYYYSLNMLAPIFNKSPELRQALSMAVDRDALTRDVVPFQIPLYSFATKTVNNGTYKNSTVAWANLSREQQISQAQELYKKAGYNVMALS